MATLHTINKAPSHSELWNSCLSAILPGDSLLCIESGVYSVLNIEVFDSIDLNCVAFLKADLEARGLETDLKVVDDTGFVTLSCEHDKTVSWF